MTNSENMSGIELSKCNDGLDVEYGRNREVKDIKET